MLKTIQDQLAKIPLITMGKFYELAGTTAQEWHLGVLRTDQGKKIKPSRIAAIRDAINTYHNVMIDLMCNEMTDENYKLIKEKEVSHYSPEQLEEFRLVLDSIDKRLVAYLASENADPEKTPAPKEQEETKESTEPTEPTEPTPNDLAAKLNSAPFPVAPNLIAARKYILEGENIAERAKRFLSTPVEDIYETENPLP